MGLAAFVAEVEGARKSMTVYAPSEPDWIVDQFATRNVTVDYRPLPVDAGVGFVIIADEGGFLASIGIPTLRQVFEPPSRRPGRDSPQVATYRELFDVLEETIFTTLDRRQLLGAAREIEDRAFRAGRGTLRVGFQRPEAMRAQESVYERLATETDLDVHLYVRSEWSPESHPALSVHAETTVEIGSFWFLAFDGGDEELNACALVAEERLPDRYYGFWTYDPELVSRLLEYLQSRYG